MLSLRLQTIASFINQSDNVADIGCDHAYLSIYLKKYSLCKSVIATDINENAFNIAKKNIEKSQLDIPVFLSDGLESVSKNNIDTLIISGMGTNNILHIIDTAKNFDINKLVVQSNNDLYLLRTSLKKRNFYLQKEKVVYDKDHYYTIGVYEKKYVKLKFREYLFGMYDATNKPYYISLYNELVNISKKVTWKNKKEKIKLLIKIKLLKKYL
jgi:tRNA (adenine22-N1)-methyltransferase